MLGVYYGSAAMKNGKIYNFGCKMWIFSCPRCEYLITARREDLIFTIAETHYKLALSTHRDMIPRDSDLYAKS